MILRPSQEKKSFSRAAAPKTIFATFSFFQLSADSNKKCRSNQKGVFLLLYKRLEIFPEMCDNCAVFTQGSVLLKKCESMQSIFREWRLKCRDSLGNSFCSAQKTFFFWFPSVSMYLLALVTLAAQSNQKVAQKSAQKAFQYTKMVNNNPRRAKPRGKVQNWRTL